MLPCVADGLVVSQCLTVRARIPLEVFAVKEKLSHKTSSNPLHKQRVYADGSVASDPSITDVPIPLAGFAAKEKFSHKTPSTPTELAAIRVVCVFDHKCVERRARNLYTMAFRSFWCPVEHRL